MLIVDQELSVFFFFGSLMLLQKWSSATRGFSQILESYYMLADHLAIYGDFKRRKLKIFPNPLKILGIS
jgi:hypothetical protein